MHFQAYEWKFRPQAGSGSVDASPRSGEPGDPRAHAPAGGGRCAAPYARDRCRCPPRPRRGCASSRRRSAPCGPVGLPLLDALDVVTTVVLDDDAHLRPAEVEAPLHLAVDHAHRDVHDRLRQSPRGRSASAVATPSGSPRLAAERTAATSWRRRPQRDPTACIVARRRSLSRTPWRRTIQAPATTSSTREQLGVGQLDEAGRGAGPTPAHHAVTTVAAPGRR